MNDYKNLFYGAKIVDRPPEQKYIHDNFFSTNSGIMTSSGESKSRHITFTEEVRTM